MSSCSPSHAASFLTLSHNSVDTFTVCPHSFYSQRLLLLFRQDVGGKQGLMRQEERRCGIREEMDTWVIKGFLF